MPPDQAGQGMASMLAALGKTSELAAIGSELFGVKTSGDLFVGLAKSDTVQNAIVRKFDLFKVYGVKRLVDARKRLEGQTEALNRSKERHHYHQSRRRRSKARCGTGTGVCEPVE